MSGNKLLSNIICKDSPKYIKFHKRNLSVSAPGLGIVLTSFTFV